MDGKLEEPTAKFDDLTNIAGGNTCFKRRPNISDNRNGFYNQAYTCSWRLYQNDCCEYLLNKKYSKFKATIFIKEGSNWDGSANLTIICDEQKKYVSPDMLKTSDPIDIEVDITNVDNFKILFSDEEKICIANAGFYQ